MKSPPLQIHDDIARKRVEAFIRGEDNETLIGDGAGRPEGRATWRRSRSGRRVRAAQAARRGLHVDDDRSGAPQDYAPDIAASYAPHG